MRGKGGGNEAAELAALEAEMVRLQAEAGDFDSQMKGMRGEIDQRHAAAATLQKAMTRSGKH